MELGQKIRQARLDAGLSQRQLCGDTITRNMLSLIENGSAQPSMDTLRFLASQLKLPVSYFLGEPTVSPEQTLLSQIWAALEAGDSATAYPMLTELPDTGEARLLRACTALALAQQALEQQRLPYARSVLHDAAEYCQNSPICSQELERRRLILLFQTAPQEASALAAALDDSELLLRAQAALSTEHPQQSAALLFCAADQKSADWIRLQADTCFALGNYTQAAQYYQCAEDRSLRQLELCYEKLGDYKMAYHYACKQREK